MRILKPLLVLVFLISFSIACASHGGGSFYQKGVASWYGKSFNGLPTASGEIYDMHKMTAAHKKLPFGTIVNVYCPETGRWVRVRITDRGPFIRGRIIDLSYAAAKELGTANLGVAYVHLYIAGNEDIPPAGPSSGETSTSGLTYVVQAGAFKSEENARGLKERISEFIQNVTIEPAGEYYRVLLGPYNSLEKAEEAADTLSKNNIQSIVREK